MRDGERIPAYGTKRCPRCGAQLYQDMQVCYGCLYDFSRGERPVEIPGLPPEVRLVERGPLDVTCVLVREEEGAVSEEVGMYVQTESVDVWVAVPERGLTLGRSPANDVVLHSGVISRSHLRVTPTPDGMEVEDLSSTNPARYRGREMRERVIVPYGDAIELCGCQLTMTGPPPERA